MDAPSPLYDTFIKAMDGRITAKAGHDYEVVSWGNGTWGQLGHGTQSNDRVPRVLGALHRKRVVFVAAGFHHSVALTGNIFYTPQKKFKYSQTSLHHTNHFIILITTFYRLW